MSVRVKQFLLYPQCNVTLLLKKCKRNISLWLRETIFVYYAVSLPSLSPISLSHTHLSLSHITLPLSHLTSLYLSTNSHISLPLSYPIKRFSHLFPPLSIHCRNLTDKQLDFLASVCKTQAFIAGDVIFEEGDPRLQYYHF